MKVLALNSSPRATGQSKTELMLSHLVGGMKAAGAEVETINLRQKKVNYCLGCYSCWTKTPGVCVHKDDMSSELLPKWQESDIAVYASPLYHYTVNAQMKAFVERTLPVAMPYFSVEGERTTHPVRGRRPAASVVVSVAGFPDEAIFDALSAWAKTVFRTSLLAEIYRPAAESMVFSPKKESILGAVEQAGRELVTQKTVSPETMRLIKQPIAERNVLAAVVNSSWKAMIREGLTPAEAGRMKHNPRPDSIETLMGMLMFGFNPGKAAGKKGILQFHFTGERPGDCFFAIDEKDCIPHQGRAERADCTVESPFEVWADIIQGTADGEKMFMEGKYTARGNLSLMTVFGRGG